MQKKQSASTRSACAPESQGVTAAKAPDFVVQARDLGARPTIVSLYFREVRLATTIA